MEKTILRLDGPDHETEYSYDAHDNLTLAVDGLGHATGYFYDDFGNVLFVNAPDTGQSEFQYDKANNLIQKTDAGYTTTSYTYDAMNRLTTIDLTFSTLPVQMFVILFSFKINMLNLICMRLNMLK